MELSTSSGLINSVVQKRGEKVEIGCCSFLVPFKPEALVSGLTEFCVAFARKANARKGAEMHKQNSSCCGAGRGKKCTKRI